MSRKQVVKQEKEIPRYSQIINDYQYNTIQRIRKITDNFVESQKEIIVNSFRLWSDWMISPRQVAENYFLLFNFILNKSNNVLKKSNIL
jgi:hypothetical protein